MKEHKEYGYIMFPILLMKQFHVNRHEAINKMLGYGIYEFSIKQSYKIDEVARQVCYGNYKALLPAKLGSLLSKKRLKYFGKDIANKGFDITGDSFMPIDEINEILIEFDKDKVLNQLAIEFYKIHTVLSILDLRNGSIDSIIDDWKIINKATPKGTAMAMVKVDLLLEYRSKKWVSEFELMQFAGYVSVRSILGIKRCVKTNYDLLRARMFGFTHHHQVDEGTLKSELFRKYLSRYHMDKMMSYLETNWHVMRFSKYMRGFYLSIQSRMTWDKLIEVAEKSKQSSKKKDLKACKQRAFEKYKALTDFR